MSQAPPQLAGSQFGRAGQPSPRNLEGAVQSIAELVVTTASFRAAAISMVRSRGELETVAVAGSAEARSQLIGRTMSLAGYEEEFAVAEHWGRLFFVPHDRLPDAADRGWVPKIPVRSGRSSWHPLDALYAPLWGSDGQLCGVMSIDLPVDGRRPGRRSREILEALAAQAEIALENAALADQLRTGRELFRLAFDNATAGMAIISLAAGDFGRYIRVNPALCRILGRPEPEILGASADAFVAAPDAAEATAELSATGGVAHQSERRYLLADGRQIWAHVTTTPVSAGGGDVPAPAAYAVQHLEDITIRRALQNDLSHRAHHDPLTDLPNRAALLLRLQMSVDQVARTGRSGAVFFVDMDGFKLVNDRYGHLFGDDVLRLLALRLSETVRVGDMVGRLGGDEFLVIAADVDVAAAEEVADRLAAAVNRPITVRGVTTTMSASIGIAMIGEDRPRPEWLIDAADRAMYNVKQRRARDLGAARLPVSAGEPWEGAERRRTLRSFAARETGQPVPLQRRRQSGSTVGTLGPDQRTDPCLQVRAEPDRS